MDDLRKQMKQTLATVFSFYLKTHYFHWNVEGPAFYEYHKMFDKISSDVYGSIDPLAEHIRTLSTYAPGSLTRFLELTEIQDELDIPTSTDMLQILHDDNAIVIASLAKSLDLANKDNMQGLVNFLADRLDKHNKWAWFLRASKKQG